MQLGTRWPVGGERPTRLPDTVGVAVESVEAELAAESTGDWRWTLTWLEGRPVVELDDAGAESRHDGTVIRVDAVSGLAVVVERADDEADG